MITKPSLRRLIIKCYPKERAPTENYVNFATEHSMKEHEIRILQPVKPLTINICYKMFLTKKLLKHLFYFFYICFIISIFFFKKLTVDFVFVLTVCYVFVSGILACNIFLKLQYKSSVHVKTFA